MTVVVFRP